jgi:DNA polymerase delta subunit 1
MSRWRRPDVPPMDVTRDPVVVQWLDVETTVGKRLEVNPAGRDKPVPGAPAGLVPILRFYGVNETGNSVLIFVHGFTPYLYAQCPPG